MRGAFSGAAGPLGEDERRVKAVLVLANPVAGYSSFLTRAWTCDRSGADGQYYMVDHVAETLGSDWFQQRNH